jgi:3-hydroxyisobutyrate dehydrogenase-like beta-hydroxyacid dehydrogenase
MDVSILGLGLMGGSMCERLLEEGLRPRVFDVDPARVSRLASLGAEASTAEGVAEGDVLLTSLPSDAVVESALLSSGLVASLRGRVLVELSTILPPTMEKVAAAAAEHGVAVVDCPVSGGPVEARAGTLTLLVGADDDAWRRAEPVLARLGTAERVGRPGQGKAIKLVNNVMAMGNMVIAAEAFALGEKLGLDPSRMFDVLSRSGGRSHHFLKRMPYVLERDFTARFALALGEKDLRLALDMAHQADYVMPATSTVHQMYEIGRARGLEGEDIAAIVKLYEEWGGVDAEP